MLNPVRHEVTNYLYFNGITRGIKQTEVRPRVPGYLEKVNFKADTQVKEGDPLVIIDQKPYKVAVQRADAVLLGKRATVASAKANLDRVRTLVTQQAASDQELIDKQAAYELAVAEAAVAEAELNDAKLNLDFTEVRSPISGRISKNMVDEGTLVRVNEPVIATIVADNEIYVDFQVSEAEFLDYIRKYPRSRLNEPNPNEPTIIDLGMADEAGFPHRGKVVSGDNTVDPGTGTYGVRGWFDNADKQIVPGLYVRIRAQMGSGQAMLVPDVAIQADPRGQFVYVVNDKNVAERRAIMPGPQAGAYRRIISGLETTDKVIVNGLMMVRPEAVVNPKFVDPPPIPTIAPADANPTTQPATTKPSTTQPATPEAL
ncbi:MAG: efflux RND transporter periplasmic adaptor subunit [Anaerolineae bacterium]|nr:efflux RND transporter periplasmic adaptor subunit [Phycisphaerae bacterium]